ncbi:hypothetical protein EGP99_04240 [bacterium]|jgi:uncharacterized protein YneF (UPF0154 family)|nr:hypothetical protein [bacterium]
MTSILEFLSKHYLIFDLIALFLIFSLIGYFVSRKKEKDVKFKLDSNNNTQNISEVNTMQNQINTNMSLQDLVKENKNIGNNESSNL